MTIEQLQKKSHRELKAILVAKNIKGWSCACRETIAGKIIETLEQRKRWKQLVESSKPK